MSTGKTLLIAIIFGFFSGILLAVVAIKEPRNELKLPGISYRKEIPALKSPLLGICPKIDIRYDKGVKEEEPYDRNLKRTASKECRSYYGPGYCLTILEKVGPRTWSAICGVR